jgi:uncharacterized protein CbrC (UPF0167 family)
MDQFEADLTCLITGRLLEDPITVTCCGRAFSRLPLLKFFDTIRPTKKCPVCSADLSAFDAVDAPMNVTVAGLVDTFKNNGNQPLPIVAQIIKKLYSNR